MISRLMLIVCLLSGFFSEISAQEISLLDRGQILKKIGQELFRNNFDLLIKNSIPGKAYIVVDPVSSEESIRIEDSTSAAMKLFMHFSVDRQMDILSSYDWPIFPLPDSLYIWDKSCLIAQDKDIWQLSSDNQNAICITSKNIDGQQNMLILDTMSQNQRGIFVRFYATSLKDGEYIIFRLDKGNLGFDRVKIWGMLCNTVDDKNIY
ncbi:hypothetical protein [Edaphocola aurantiacus]|uniref:hypothetical protein n=1 Tax=Edaphocola aurantiacus TaxID=2601682 RepID=UPI001C97CF73|nr:hypothetical protein [Edaphocola aurantiacus]